MSNTYVNQVSVNGSTIIDLTGDTVTASALAQGYTAHDASGAPITGSMTGGSMVIRDESDSHGGTIRHITAGDVVTGTLSIASNGTYDVAAYADAEVDVPSAAPTLQSKTATPTETAQTITADSGYDGLSSVSVGAIDSSYVGSAITRRTSTDLTASGATVTAPAGYYAASAAKSVASGSATTPATSITANPTISVDSNGLITATVSGSKSVTPTVSAGYVSSGTAGTVTVSGSNTSQLSTQAAATITPSTASQTAVAAGKYTTGAVTVAAMPSGTAGTPTAAKVVSGNTATVTPSVTNTTGYITGGTVSGTAVTVTASELASGNKAITENGTGIDVVGYSTVSVDVSGSSIDVEPLSVTSNGTYTAPSGTAYSPVTVNVSGGGTGGDMSDPIRFFDYDGTLVASYSSVPSALPSVPTHSGLTNGTWNYTLAQVTAQYNAMGTCDVGANYDTSSGATEIDIVLQEGRLHPYLSLAVNGTVTIDWGDNSTSTSTGTSLTARIADIEHEYAAAGEYTISISKTSGTGYSLYCTTTYTLLNKNSSTANANRVYANCVQAVRVGADCTVGSYAFYYCCSLASVSIPSGVTSIGASAFYYCYGMAEYHILPTTPPTLSNANAFTNIQSDCVIYVPSASLADYQAATNWSTYASYMVGE